MADGRDYINLELFNSARRDIERYLNQPAIREAIENHKSNWIPESNGGEPNCKRRPTMATINYNGMELEEITEPQIFDPPRKCFVWDYHIEEGETRDVLSIFPESSGFSDRVYTTTGTSFKHCALLPEKPAPRRATNRELAKWLAQGNGEFTQGIEVSGKGPFTKTTSYYDASISNNAVDDEVKVRKWDDTEWHEPTVDYMGIEEKEEGTDV